VKPVDREAGGDCSTAKSVEVVFEAPGAREGGCCVWREGISHDCSRSRMICALKI